MYDFPMKFSQGVIVAIFVLVGCDAKIGKDAGLPDVAIYPGAKITSNGENNGVIGANLEITDSPAKVIAFYAKELGVTPDPSGAGNLKGTKNGHEFTIIVTPAAGGKTAVTIVEPKH